MQKKLRSNLRPRVTSFIETSLPGERAIIQLPDQEEKNEAEEEKEAKSGVFV